MSFIGETVGHYVGDLQVKRLSAGRYQVTGPRGSCIVSKARERVYVRSWARSRTVTMTVWNPSDCTVASDAHGAPLHMDLWGKTLREAVDNLTPVLCHYRIKR